MTATGKCSWQSGWTAKRQITGEIIIPLKYSVDNSVAPVKGCLHPVLTPSLATPVYYSSTLLLEGENSSTPVLSSPALTPPCPASATLTSPYPSVTTPDPPCPAFAAPASPPKSTPPSDVYFRLEIKETLQHADLAQGPYPPTEAQEADDLESTDKSTAEAIGRAPSLLA